MALSDHQKRLYARHLILKEIGLDGQAHLCARDATPRSTHPFGAQVERSYLHRAGFRLAAEEPVETPTSAEEDDPFALADAALRGAFFAVEQIKETLGVGTIAPAPPPLAHDAALANTPQPEPMSDE